MSLNNKENRGKLQVLASSMSASLVGTILMNPLEVAKLNMQYFPLACPNYPHQNYRQMFSCGCRKFNFEGSIKSLKLAIPQALFSSILFMQIYQPTRRYLVDHAQMGATFSTVGASLFSRLLVGSANIPFQSLRIRVSNRVKDSKINFVGYRITLIRDLIYSSIFWSSFETYRNLICRGDYRNNLTQVKDFTWKNFMLNMLPAFIFGASTSALTTPLDTLKTRIQSQGIKKYSISEGLQQIYAKEGLLGLFSGVQWRIFKNGGHTAIYMYVYEWMMKHLTARNTEKAESIDQI